MKSMLIIEDDENLRRGISFTFSKDGYNVTQAGTVSSGLRLFAQTKPEIIILDLNLPDGSGMDFCKAVREKSDVPVIMLTARDMETDEVSGFMAGADDYITKPFSLSVLRARVENVLRRLGANTNNNRQLQSGSLRLDTGACKLFRDGVEIPVSATEYRLLHFFIQNAGQVLTKEQILAALWDDRGNFVDENTLSVYISRLRTKLGNDAAIKTIHKIGYTWVKG